MKDRQEGFRVTFAILVGAIALILISDVLIPILLPGG